MKIFYYCPCSNKPCGGIKVIYQHVQVLHENGFEVYVLHPKPNFKCTWFKHQTPVANYSLSISNLYNTQKKLTLPNGKKYTLKNEDIIVIPEVYGPNFKKIAPNNKKVIFNQGAYLSFKKYSLNLTDKTGNYLDNNIIASLCISEDTYKNIQFAFPTLPIYRVQWSLNTSIFHYQGNKKPIVAYMPRKNIEHARHIINLLKFHGGLDNITIRKINNKTELEVSEILKESLIFINLGSAEGLPLPPAEAMASGCLVIGYHGNGGKEYMLPEFCYPTEVWSILEICNTILEVTSNYKKNPLFYEKKCINASKFIHNNYSKEKEKERLLSAWKNILEHAQK
jgi:glycosyltransferase involved in cell wall biosynthesis